MYTPGEISAGNPSDICQSLAKGASLQGTFCDSIYTCRLIILFAPPLGFFNHI